jgi:hypothetical protein
MFLSAAGMFVDSRYLFSVWRHRKCRKMFLTPPGSEHWPLLVKIMTKETDRMTRIKLVGLCLVAVFAFGAVAVAEAAAAEYIYKVNGKKLEASEKKEITSKAKTEFTLTGEESVLGTKVKAITKCKKLKLNAAEKPVIVGGTPGKSEKEKIEFEECTATLGGSKCSSVTIESASTNNEIVTIVLPASKAGKLGVLFTPASGKVFTTVKLKSCGIFGSHEAKVEGSSAALVGSEKTEAVAGTLVYSETEEITEIEKSNNTKEKVGLKFAGNPSKINGEAEVELVSKEKWGVF